MPSARHAAMIERAEQAFEGSWKRRGFMVEIRALVQEVAEQDHPGGLDQEEFEFEYSQILWCAKQIIPDSFSIDRTARLVLLIEAGGLKGHRYREPAEMR